jgi:DNA-binding LacI/PurR family transcriptional regulator
MRVSLKDIAKESGVSISTVSRVINKNGFSFARPELQDKIWEIVNRTGYLPNENALNLRKGRKYTPNSDISENKLSIACLFARTPESIKDPFFSQLARSVEAAAFKENYHVQYSLTEIDMKKPEMLRNISGKRVKGVVILGRCDKDLLYSLQKYFKYVSYTGLNALDAKYDQVICDGREVSKAAVSYLVGLEHKNIAYIGEINNESRFEGYKAALEGHGILFNKSYVADVMHSTENGYRGARELLRKAADITAVLCANDITAIGAISAFREAGVCIPRDISVMGIDDIDIAPFMPIKLTSVHVPIDELGQIATRVLIDRINNGHTIHMKITLPFYIAERDSCARPPRSPYKKSAN